MVTPERRGDTLEELIDDSDDVAVAAITVAELLVRVQLATGRGRIRRTDENAFADLPRVSIRAP